MRVYLDPSLLTVGSTGPNGPLAPGVEEAIANLAEAGHEVVVLGSVPAGVHEARPAATIPDRGADGGSADGGWSADGWLVTTDRAACESRRRRGLRTVLVGPHEADPTLPTVRCDELARDLHGAVLVILAAEAMG